MNKRPTTKNRSEADKRRSWSLFIQRLSSAVWYTALLGVIVLLASSRTDAQDRRVQFLEGFSQPNRISRVAAIGSGVVNAIHAEEGALVKQGQCLVELDDTIHEKQLQAAEISMRLKGELQAAEAQLNSASQRVEIIRQIAKLGSATPEELLRAENEYALAKANLLTTHEKLTLRKADYEKLKAESNNYCIRAPFDGVLVEALRAEGEFVGPADPNVCVVAEINRLSVELLVPRLYRAGFRLQSDVEIRFVESGKNLPGRVYYISPYAKGDTGTYQIKIRVENPRGEVNAGERCVLEYSNGSPLAAKSPASKGSKFVSKKAQPTTIPKPQ